MNCNQKPKYEHHFAFMATFMDANENHNDDNNQESPPIPPLFQWKLPFPEKVHFISVKRRGNYVRKMQNYKLSSGGLPSLFNFESLR